MFALSFLDYVPVGIACVMCMDVWCFKHFVIVLKVNKKIIVMAAVRRQCLIQLVSCRS